jgi:hypothetical protein
MIDHLSTNLFVHSILILIIYVLNYTFLLFLINKKYKEWPNNSWSIER